MASYRVNCIDFPSLILEWSQNMHCTFGDWWASAEAGSRECVPQEEFVSKTAGSKWSFKEENSLTCAGCRNHHGIGPEGHTVCWVQPCVVWPFFQSSATRGNIYVGIYFSPFSSSRWYLEPTMQVNSIHSEFSFEYQELKKRSTLKIICCKFYKNNQLRNYLEQRMRKNILKV